MQSLASHLEELSQEKERRRRLSEQDDDPLSPAEVLEERPSEAVTAIGQYFVPFRPIDGEAKSTIALDRSTGEQLSCRVYDLKSFHTRMFLFSTGHMKGVHPIQEVLQSETRAYVFSDLTYGDLHHYLREKKKLSEVEAAPLFQQIVELVKEAHSRGIALRDIKLKKFIFEDESRTSLSLHYLDDAQLMDASGLLADRHGCPAYVCPEMLQPGSYSGQAADLWSLGVILYTLLVGHYPFFDISTQNLFSKVRGGYYQVPDHVSELARSLIGSLLAYDPSSRVPAWAILGHPWFTYVTEENFTPVLARSVARPHHKDQTVPDA